MAGHAPTDDDHLDRMPTDQELVRLQWTTVLYYLHETNPDNELGLFELLRYSGTDYFP